MTSRPAAAQHLRDLARLRRVRDRIDREYAQPLERRGDLSVTEVCFAVGCSSLATADLDGTFAGLQASGAEIIQEPTDQPYGIRDCAVRDPAGNHVRINEVR